MNTSDTAAFDAERHNLLRLAYRMLGIRGDAEDAVQEAYLRLQRSQATPDNRAAWLTRTCVRLCLDRLRSARAQRETYLGPWLPEPWVEPASLDTMQLDESLSIALIALLERLSPGERAALLLHDVFDYKFEDIAAVLDLDSAHCRKLASRARQQLKADRAGRSRAQVSDETFRRMAEVFYEAVHSGDMKTLQSVLAEDVVLQSDGGGKVIAARRPVVGDAKVARFIARAIRPGPETRTQFARINGAPGLLLRTGDITVAAMTFTMDGERIDRIFVVRNPDKLARIDRDRSTLHRSLGPSSGR